VNLDLLPQHVRNDPTALGIMLLFHRYFGDGRPLSYSEPERWTVPYTTRERIRFATRGMTDMDAAEEVALAHLDPIERALFDV
jgi:hypothetical protein